MRDETDRILLEAAGAGASLDDLATIAACAIEGWRRQRPDPDSPDDGFDDRYLQIGVTFGGAAVIRGNLTPECAAAVRAVTEALGKQAGPEDDRTEGKRFHDALQLACAPQPRVCARVPAECALSGQFELLVAEVGDELEGAAECGDEPAEHVLGGDVSAFDLGDSRDRHSHPGRDLLLGHPAPLAHLGQPPAAGVVQHRVDRRIEGLLAAGRLNGPLQVPGLPPA
jgi:hypothetical protein